jgi:3-hydroxy-9,10-secoandrosta-1,3,5(10)-triene-9,17-dione monooxygenase
MTPTSNAAIEARRALGRPQYETIEEAVAIARGLAPKLRERVPQAEALRRLPNQNVADLLASGLIDLETPRMWGGAELNLDALIEVTAALAEGCSATAWVYALWAAHVWLIGQYPLHVQEEVLSDPNTLVSSVVNTVGDPVKVDGGYRWAGKGFFSSGVDHCNWLIASVPMKRNDTAPGIRWFIIPRSAFDIVDDWHTVGLKGSGSKTIEVRETFIPDDWALAATDLSSGVAPGAQIHGSPLYCAAMDFTFSLPLAGPALGIARNVERAFEARLRTRLESPNPRIAAEQLASLTRLAEASTKIDAARALVLDTARRFCTIPAAEATPMDRAKCRRDVAYCTHLCRQAANELFEAAGASNIFDSADMQRLWRDANVAASHHGLQWDVHAMGYARAVVGLPPTSALGEVR